jgi:polysaccharide pyruvyl transferase WcaK-like protein
MHKVVIAGETFSPNLGDGVIAESLAFLFCRASPDISVRFLDISGRTTWENTCDKHAHQNRWTLLKRKLSAVHSRPVCTFFHLLNWYVLSRRSCVRNGNKLLADSSLLVIGGGQLLMDNCLDFPLKINCAARLASAHGISVHFSACGVGKNWSPIAFRLFNNSLSDASTVTVRDSVSQEHLRRLLPRLPSSPLATFDPAIWASEVYGMRNGRKRSKPCVGLGVIAPREVNTHAPHGCKFTGQALVDFWLDIIVKLHQIGVVYEVFTNGSPSDYAFAVNVRREVEDRLSIDCPLRERPLKPRELAHRISEYQAVVASRLHANVVALSYGIPVVGLIWDDKVKAISVDAGRKNRCVSIYDRNPDAIVESLMESFDEGVDAEALRQCKERALENVEIVLDDLSI